ncbi:tripartite tricarboxylate transporter permease [Starkeya sp. ORNL1]|uniref:tripartite tricarboxylate transporter permease n=1 Tax=Starkeya sp. ORNL1 TaxID=2709380 RepID=UPI001463F229|nr:tripartite tricarboxylate transporter permease [Starkeya sp. ORNL1]QJP14955.1 tripartite tricarboxylate transporter permease [Starkeya sp. ORNL1]
MDSFSGILGGFAVALQPEYLGLALLGALLGTAIGVLPGMGASLTISLLLPFTFKLVDPVGALILFGGIFYGAQYGGSTTSILINTPGESSSVVTAIDGYRMARKGRAGAALACAAIGSFYAGTIATFLMMVLAQPLVNIALDFGPSEYFAIMVLSLGSVTALGSGHPMKAAFSTLLGLMMATIGIDATSGQLRFTFGEPSLFDGIDVVVCAIGLFAISEVIFSLGNLRRQEPSGLMETGKLFMTREEWRRSFWPWTRGTVIGFIIGVLPGVGATIASFMSYGIERKVSKHPEEFGKGAIEGVAGPEAANNASAGGALVPLLTLGIPGSATAAVMLSALQGYGIVTGPLLLDKHPEIVWGLIASLYIGNVMLLVLNLPLVGMWVKLLKVPETILYPIIIAISTIGAYSLSRNVMDVYIMFGIGIVGAILRAYAFPLAPIVLGLVLGGQLETEFRRALIGSRGDWWVFVDRPLAASILLCAVAVVLLPVVTRLRAFWRARRAALT